MSTMIAVAAAATAPSVSARPARACAGYTRDGNTGRRLAMKLASKTLRVPNAARWRAPTQRMGETRRRLSTRASSKPGTPPPPSEEAFAPWTDPGRMALAAGWVGLGSAAAIVAPQGTSGFDMELITTLISAPFSGAANPIFEALFNSLGVVPAVYAALLLPGAKDQPRLPAVPPIAASFALGFFALGPYLFLREPREGPVARSSLGWATRTVFESKPFALFNAGFALFLTGYAATHWSADALTGFVQLWTEQSALCCVSSCDLLVLSLAMYGALSEDMKRRGVFEPAKAAAFCALPVVGPTLWLVTRPALEE